MAKKNYSIDQLATATARQAQSEVAMVQRDIGKLRDSVSGLTRGIKTPAIRPPRTRTKKTTTISSLGDILDLAATGGLSLAGLSGSTSLSQQAGKLMGMITLAQRIR